MWCMAKKRKKKALYCDFLYNIFLINVQNHPLENIFTMNEECRLLCIDVIECDCRPVQWMIHAWPIIHSSLMWKFVHMRPQTWDCTHGHINASSIYDGTLLKNSLLQPSWWSNKDCNPCTSPVYGPKEMVNDLKKLFASYQSSSEI